MHALQLQYHIIYPKKKGHGHNTVKIEQSRLCNSD